MKKIFAILLLACLSASAATIYVPKEKQDLFEVTVAVVPYKDLAVAVSSPTEALEAETVPSHREWI